MAQNGISDELSTRQQKAIAALLSCKNIRQAAGAANVGERTLYKWLKTPAFTAALREAEGTAISEATRQLVGMASTALDQVRTILEDDTTSATLRLRAAQVVLENLLKLRELGDQEVRLANLEANRNVEKY